MKALTYIGIGRFEVTEKAKPVVVEATDAVVRVTLSSICTSDLHIKHGSVPRAVSGKNLTFKTGGVDGCDCDEILRLISEGKIDTTPLITHTFPSSQIEEAYDMFESRSDNVIKVAIKNDNIDNYGEEV